MLEMCHKPLLANDKIVMRSGAKSHERSWEHCCGARTGGPGRSWLSDWKRSYVHSRLESLMGTAKAAGEVVRAKIGARSSSAAVGHCSDFRTEWMANEVFTRTPLRSAGCVPWPPRSSVTLLSTSRANRV